MLKKMTEFEVQLRAKLLTTPYTPSCCGNIKCDQPTIEYTTVVDGQFECPCGWRSSHDEEFMTKYTTLRATIESN